MELIVVITILAILGTIWFVSLQNYSRYARDSTRISDMKTMERALEFVKTRVGSYPTPDDASTVYYSGASLFTQGVFWQQAAGQAGITPAPIDPTSSLLYGYSVANNKSEFQIAGIFEREVWFWPVIWQSYADAKTAYVKLSGMYNNKFLVAFTWGISYVVALPSLFRADTRSDILSIYQNKNIVVHGGTNLPSHYSSSSGTYAMTGGVNFWALNPIIYSGTLDNLIHETDRLTFAKNLSTIFKNSDARSSLYSTVIGMNPLEDPTAAKNYVASLVLAETAGINVPNYAERLLYGAIDWYNYFKSSDDSINSNNILSISSSPVWGLWFGTNGGGVSYYNGSSWINYTVVNTVSQLKSNVVNDVLVGSGNIAWIATAGGLNRFNGTSWVWYTTSNTNFPGNTVREVAEDSLWNIWIATNGGIWKFNGTAWTRFNTTNGLPWNDIRSIYIDAQDKVWIAVYGFGVLSYNGSTWTTYNTSNTASALANNNILRVWGDIAGNIWVSTNAAWVSRLIQTTGVWTKYNTTTSLANNTVNMLMGDAQGNMWFGNTAGISKFDGTIWTKYTTTLGSDNIQAMAQDEGGSIWFGSINKGVTKFDGVNWVAYIKSSNLVSNLIKAVSWNISNENIRIGTWDMGANKFDGDETWVNYDTNTSNIGSNAINDVLVDTQGNTWLATTSGLSRQASWQTAWTRYVTTQGLWNNNVLHLYQDSSGLIWAATSGGVSKQTALWAFTWMNYNTTHGLVNNTVYDIVQDNSGAMWFGTAAWVSRLSWSTWTTYNTTNTSSNIPSNTITALGKDGNGDIWIGTSAWLSKYTMTSSTWSKYLVSNGVSNSYITSIATRSNGDIWIGTRGGINKYNPSNNSFSVYTTAHGMIDNYVNDLHFDENTLWIGTNNGISKGTFK